MDFVVPKRTDVSVALGTISVVRAQPRIVGVAQVSVSRANGLKSISSNLLPYNNVFALNLHSRVGSPYAEVNSFVVPFKTIINAFRGVAGADGGGTGSNTRPAYGQLFPRGDS